MIPKHLLPRTVLLEVVNHEEYVEYESELDPDGKQTLKRSLDGKPIKIEGSETAFLHLKALDGKIIRAQISHENLDKILALRFPEDFDKK